VSCPDCGTPLPAEAIFCPGCGINLSARLCPDCGTELAEGATFCHVCGRRIAAPSPAAVTGEATEREQVMLVEAPSPAVVTSVSAPPTTDTARSAAWQPNGCPNCGHPEPIPADGTCPLCGWGRTSETPTAQRLAVTSTQPATTPSTPAPPKPPAPVARPAPSIHQQVVQSQQSYLQPPHHQAAAVSNTLSVIAIVLGAVAFFFLPPIFGAAGIILAVIGMTRKEKLAPVGLAVAVLGLLVGMLIGYVVAS
jgi:uncharacterized Zn finger protein (UPF0148 family)